MPLEPVVLETLDQQLHPAVIAECAGNPDKDVVRRWLNGDSQPSDDEIRRLNFAYERLMEVASIEGFEVARTWFIGANVRDTLSPAEAIGRNDFTGVSASARQLIQDGFS